MKRLHSRLLFKVRILSIDFQRKIMVFRVIKFYMCIACCGIVYLSFSWKRMEVENCNQSARELAENSSTMRVCRTRLYSRNSFNFKYSLGYEIQFVCSWIRIPRPVLRSVLLWEEFHERLILWWLSIFPFRWLKQKFVGVVPESAISISISVWNLSFDSIDNTW